VSAARPKTGEAALALWGVSGLALAQVRGRVSPVAIVGAAAAAGWASLHRWSRAVRAGRLFPVVRTLPAEATPRQVAARKATTLAAYAPGAGVLSVDSAAFLGAAHVTSIAAAQAEAVPPSRTPPRATNRQAWLAVAPPPSRRGCNEEPNMDEPTQAASPPMPETPPLAPKDHAAAVAIFRSEIVGALTRKDLDHGELRAAFRVLTQERFRPPGSGRRAATR
jgi:hypothetical protein